MSTPDLRDVLARNLRAMIGINSQSGDAASIRAWAMSKGLNVRLIDRLTKKQHAITLDKLQLIADACGLQPWQLLIEDLDPKRPPDITLSEDDRALLRRLRALIP